MVADGLFINIYPFKSISASEKGQMLGSKTIELWRRSCALYIVRNCKFLQPHYPQPYFKTYSQTKPWRHFAEVDREGCNACYLDTNYS